MKGKTLRQIEYKKYQIVVIAHPPAKETYWRATYEIGQSGQHEKITTGAIAGAFDTCEVAEEAAVRAGKFWVDQHSDAAKN